MAEKTADLCPDCNSFLLPGQKVCDCGWVRIPETQRRQVCDGCERTDKTLRMHHFLTVGPSQLAFHVKQFLPQMDKYMLDGYLNEVHRLYAKYSNRRDEIGAPMTAADAWLHYRVEKTQPFAQVKKRDERRRSGESERDYAKRCFDAVGLDSENWLSGVVKRITP